MAGHDKTTAVGKKLFKELKELSEMQVRVGFQRGKKHKGKGKRAGADLVDIALYNELGTDMFLTHRRPSGKKAQINR